MEEGGDSGVIAEVMKDEAGRLVVVVRPLLIMLDRVATRRSLQYENKTRSR